jgi:hypothetical protein
MQVIIFFFKQVLGIQVAPMCFFTWKNRSVIWKAYAIIKLNKSITIYVNKKTLLTITKKETVKIRYLSNYVY